MKLIIETETNRVKYAFDDSQVVVLGALSATVFDGEGEAVLLINDLNTMNSHVAIDDLPEGETLELFVGDKYLHADDEWSLNPDYVAPPPEEELP